MSRSLFRPFLNMLQLSIYVPWRFAHYSGDERRVLIRALWDIIRVNHSLNRRGYKITWTYYAQRQAPLSGAISRLQADRTGQLVSAAARWTIGLRTSCLRRAIVLCWYLRGAGVDCDLISGIGREDGDWKGHAWVEIDGRAIGEEAGISNEYPAFRDQLSRKSDKGE